MTRRLPPQTAFFLNVDGLLVRLRSDDERLALVERVDRSRPVMPVDQCDSIFWHGPGHQSRTRCTEPAGHVYHQAITSMGDFVEWEGEEGYE